MTADFPDLQGLRVFVVEDEFIVLLQLEHMLLDLGCEIAGAASRLPDALAMIAERSMDAAVLDINLGGTKVYPVADLLAARKVPIVFSTGYGNAGVIASWRGQPILQKPYRLDQLGSALSQVTAKPRLF